LTLRKKKATNPYTWGLGRPFKDPERKTQNSPDSGKSYIIGVGEKGQKRFFKQREAKV